MTDFQMTLLLFWTAYGYPLLQWLAKISAIILGIIAIKVFGLTGLFWCIGLSVLFLFVVAFYRRYQQKHSFERFKETFDWGVLRKPIHVKPIYDFLVTVEPDSVPVTLRVPYLQSLKRIGRPIPDSLGKIFAQDGDVIKLWEFYQPHKIPNHIFELINRTDPLADLRCMIEKQQWNEFLTCTHSLHFIAIAIDGFIFSFPENIRFEILHRIMMSDDNELRQQFNDQLKQSQVDLT